MLRMALKAWVRLGLFFFCKKIKISGAERLAEKGPLVLAVNHPNSFLDALLPGAFMHHSVHYLSRGDVFKRKWIRWLLGKLNMHPVYRIRDGKDKLGLNQATFDKGVEVLRAKEILLVFVEGFCAHQTTLQLPLKKGAPRIIETCWQQDIPVRILPVWLQYSSFATFGKSVSIDMGQAFGNEICMGITQPAQIHHAINEHTAKALLQLQAQSSYTPFRLQTVLQYLLAFPAIAGAVFHAPLYLPARSIVRYATRDNVHYDSVLFAVLLIAYPLYLLAAAMLLASYTSTIWMLLPLIILPVTARCFVMWK